MEQKTTIEFPEIVEINKKLDLLQELQTKKSQGIQTFDMVSAKRMGTLLDLSTQTLIGYVKLGYFNNYSFDRKLFYSLSEVETFLKNNRN